MGVIIAVLDCIMRSTMGHKDEFSVHTQTPIGCNSKINYESIRINFLCSKYYPAKVYRRDIPGEWLRISSDSLLVEGHKRARIPVLKSHYVTILNLKLLN
jgi:hypothetical protein